MYWQISTRSFQGVYDSSNAEIGVDASENETSKVWMWTLQILQASSPLRPPKKARDAAPGHAKKERPYHSRLDENGK